MSHAPGFCDKREPSRRVPPALLYNPQPQAGVAYGTASDAFQEGCSRRRQGPWATPSYPTPGAIAHRRLKAAAEAQAAAVAPAIREAQAAGAKSLRQIAAALNGRGIATARGAKWEAVTVRNVLKRVAA